MGNGDRARQVFISYRRDDTLHIAGRIRDKLATAFGDENVYFDITTIPPGVDFREHIAMMVTECEYVLVLIGTKWLDISNDHGRRLDQPDDWVRIEVATALERGIPVVPVLVDGAKLPAAAALPDVLQNLSFRNAVQVRLDPDFHPDMDRLIDGLFSQGPAVEDDGDDLGPEELFQRGAERLQEGDEEGAIGDFHIAMTFDPQAAYALCGNGLAPDLGVGAEGTWVAYLQERLVQGGVDVVVDGVYGQQTAQLVGQVQEVLGIQPDGMVGALTWLHLCLRWPGIAPPLGVGAEGPWVAHLQQRLVAGGLQLAVDGEFGPTTARAVANAQQALGLQVDGLVEAETWMALTLP